MSLVVLPAALGVENLLCPIPRLKLDCAFCPWPAWTPCHFVGRLRRCVQLQRALCSAAVYTQLVPERAGTDGALYSASNMPDVAVSANYRVQKIRLDVDLHLNMPTFTCTNPVSRTIGLLDIPSIKPSENKQHTTRTT